MPTGIKVRDAMVSGVVTGMPNQTVVEGSKIMKKEDVGSIIICEDSKPVGIVTREDIINNVVASGLLPSKVLLKDIMSTNLVTINPDSDISEAAMLMSKHKYERIPVVSMGELVGIISTREIAKVAPAALEVMTEHLRIEEGINGNEETEDNTTEGVCDLCGNESDNLTKINDRWVCDSCAEEAQGL
jgi:CBS domain-containing protein